MPYRIAWEQLAPDLYAGKQENGLYTGRLHDATGAEIKKRTGLPSQEAAHEWAAKERAKRTAQPAASTGVLYTASETPPPPSAVSLPATVLTPAGARVGHIASPPSHPFVPADRGLLLHMAPGVPARAEPTVTAPPAATTRERVLVRNAANLVIGHLDPLADGTWRASMGNDAHVTSGLVREAAETWVRRVYKQTYAGVVYPVVLNELTAADVDRAEERGELHILAEWVRRLMAGGEWGTELREATLQRMLNDDDLRAEVIEKLEDDKEIRDEVKEKLANDGDFRAFVMDEMRSEDEALVDEVCKDLREDLRQDVLDDLRNELAGEVRQELMAEAREAMAADLAATDSKGAWVAAVALLPEDVAQAVSEALAKR